ncbi:MAG: DNA-3-methyladenine glycosylase [Fimbriimonadaceae bacterium]|nr:DNA-3-methyladenine glycosylase [Fimbriimonadaceae bacterium]
MKSCESTFLPGKQAVPSSWIRMDDLAAFHASVRQGLTNWPVTESAMALLGMRLQTPGGVVSLVEVEAYGGADDPGSHAYRGETSRNSVMFGPPGHAYLYLSYGIHWLLNITARPPGEPAAILLRAARHCGEDLPSTALAGPGRLTARLGILPSFNRCDLLDPASAIHLLPGEKCSEVLVSPRIGLSAGKGEETPWRYVSATDCKFASKPHMGELQLCRCEF